MTSGVYQIVNTINGKVYIGSSKCIEKRKSQHFRALASGNHHNKALRHAALKYGVDVFTHEILEMCAESDLLLRESHWISAKNSTKTGYNVRFTPESNLGIKHTAESRANMSASKVGYKHTPEALANLSAAAKRRGVAESTYKTSAYRRRGKPLQPETRAKISAALAGRKQSPEHTAKVAAANAGSIRSAETRDKISAAQVGRKLTESQCAARRGRKQSPETIEKRVSKMRAVQQSAEHVAKRVAATKEAKSKYVYA